MSAHVPSIVKILSQDVASSPRGKAFFAHLLMPHGPYVWDENCVMKRNTGTWMTSELPYETAYEKYLAQANCITSKVGALLEQLSESPDWADGLILIHGDHGSRIFRSKSILSTTEISRNRFLIDSHSSLFAIKRPDIAPGVDHRLLSIQHIFNRLVLKEESEITGRPPSRNIYRDKFALDGLLPSEERGQLSTIPMPRIGK